jgi:type I restriction-modification system DNA methylase subunit/restriction endonuclease S subunit
MESKKYICEFCKKVFSQKNDYTRHVNKKTSCISTKEIKENKEIIKVNTDDKNKLLSIFKACENTLRTEGITGEKALLNVTYLLILKLIEPHLDYKKLKKYDFDFNEDDDDEQNQKNKKKLLKLMYFTNLSEENEDNLPINMEILWDKILSEYPLTKKIFLKNTKFDIKYKSTYQKLIKKINEHEFEKSEYDVLGNAYEKLIKEIMTGKVLGQFFTQPLIKKIMVKLIEPKIYENGKIETICDPTMGTGGFLTSYLNDILKQADLKKIKPDWEFIKTEGIYGKEIDPTTHKLAVSNMFISSGHMFEQLENGDSIREPINKKFDNILANPPFGIKGLKYSDFENPLKNEYTPIKTDNAVSLFIQAIIYMLKIKGKCAVVLPDGQDLFGKSTAFVTIREYLMKTCDLKEIYYLPSGIFTNTPIKTCIFYFVKKREGKDVLETKIELTKTQKEKERKYKFLKTHQTTKIKFYDYNPYEEVKNLLVEVPIDTIAENSYSLNYAEYLKDEIEEKQYKNDIVVKTLGEICEINQGNSLTKINMKNGLYNVIGGGKIIGRHNEKNRDGNDITFTRVGDITINYMCESYYLTDNGFSLKSTNDNIMTKYLYYFLLNNINYLKKTYKGAAQKVISKTNLKLIKINIPSLEQQQEIVNYLDFIYELTNKTSNDKIMELKKMNEFCLNNQQKFGDNVVKTLGKICNFNIGGTPSRSKNEYYENGNNLWLSVRELNGGYIHNTKEKITDLGVKNSSVKLFEKETVLFSFKLSIGKTAIVGEPLYTNEAIAGIMSKNLNLLTNKYLYHYLTINDFSKLGSGILGNGSLNKKSLEQIKILIPSLERQKEIVEYCENNNNIITQLEKEIENNKKQAKLFIENIMKLHKNDSDSDDETNSKNESNSENYSDSDEDDSD